MEFKEITCLADVDSQISEAMIEKESAVLSMLRMVKSEIQLVEKKDGKSLDKVGCTKVLMKMRDELTGSVDTFVKANRKDLVDETFIKIGVLDLFIPNDLPTMDTVRPVIDAEIDTIIGEKGKLEMRDLGRIMGKIKKEYPLIDGTEVSNYVKSKM